MNIDSENIIPARRPSGRLSKPSMELLVDNQRLLAHYIEPKKKRKVEVKKLIEEIGSQSNYSERSSLSSTDKYKPKRRKSSALVHKDNDENDKGKRARKGVDGAHELSKSDVSNGNKHMDNGLAAKVVVGHDTSLLARTPYVAIELNEMLHKTVIHTARSPDNRCNTISAAATAVADMGIISSTSPDKSAKTSPDKAPRSLDKLIKTSPDKAAPIPEIYIDLNDKSDDDLPLSKIYPDFKPRLSEPGESRRDTFTLPPKKKIKFINITELNLNGSSSSSSSSSADRAPLSTTTTNAASASPVTTPSKVPKLKLVFSPPAPPTASVVTNKTSVMSMPKIPKKSASLSPATTGAASNAPLNGSSDSDSQNSPVRFSESAASISEPHSMGLRTSASPTPPSVHQTVHVDTTKRCIRSSCTNIAIEDFRWDKEFCSPDCAIMYSKFIFSEWLNQRRDLSVGSD